MVGQKIQACRPLLAQATHHDPPNGTYPPDGTPLEGFGTRNSLHSEPSIPIAGETRPPCQYPFKNLEGSGAKRLLERQDPPAKTLKIQGSVASVPKRPSIASTVCDLSARKTFKKNIEHRKEHVFSCCRWPIKAITLINQKLTVHRMYFWWPSIQRAPGDKPNTSPNPENRTPSQTSKGWTSGES